ncbi:hypothetical protein SUGI_0922420 [Cryptomeria japonica]|uniref:uncharacterized protein LOC131079588 n=1 Tax=Cryptomeria japonica TaxID=3369 RepID=UPI0024147040|nr:uncharacterized protein LOC131079588 [Cryptomeria japonica]GLJ44192.1 hypothetical protein SUGI_0922420 [Cryptomeria japonica]
MDAYGPTLTSRNTNTNTSSSWHAPPKFHFNSLLALLNNPKSDAFLDKDNDNWKWKWEAIDFKTSAVKCPKVLNLLLGRRFSACNPSAICPARNTSASAASSSHGCSCNSNKDSLPVEIEQNKDRSSRENAIEDEELEEGQISGEMEIPLDQEEEGINSVCKQAATASQVESHCIVPRNSAFSLNEAPVQRISETKKRKKANNQRRKQQRQKKAKHSAQFQGKKKEREGDFIAEFKALEFADKQTAQQPPNQEQVDGEKDAAKKNGKITLSSFLEGEIGLWTTQTVDDVLRETKAEEGGSKKAKRGPLTAERKLKKKIVKKRKKALKDKQLGIKRLKLAPVTKPKPVILCKFFMKGRCAQGKECPFSHDAVPITKSEICKYHVNNCCLKGDECPFSHDLSTFPCKFYHTEAGCLDQDACRFSHKQITVNELEKVLKQNELGKQDLCELDSLQNTIQQISSNSLQKSEVHSTISVGNQSVNLNPLKPSNSSMENDQQVYEKKVANSAILNSGKATSNECFGTLIRKEQHMPRKNETSSWVSGNSSFLEYNRFDDLLKDDDGNDGFLSAHRAAFNALAPVADHEASLLTRGLVRVPTFISTAFAAADRVLDANCTPREHKVAQEMCCSEYLRDGNKKTPPTGLLNNSKGAMEILENILLGNKNPDKQNVCSLFSSCKTNGDTDINK